MSDVVVIGAGHVGVTLLTDLVSTQETHGSTFCLVPARNTNRQRIRDLCGPFTRTNMMTGHVDMVRLGAPHLGHLDDGVLEAARHIIITVPDIPAVRLPLIDRIARLSSLPGKVVTIVQAGQGGQPVLADWVRRTPQLRDSSLILIEDSFYGTRVTGRDIAYKRKLTVNVTAYSRTPETALDRLRGLFPLGHHIDQPSWPHFVARDGIGLLFDALGYIIHVGVALDRRNLDKTRAGITYRHYTEGVHPDLAVLLDALDRERVQLAAAYGTETPTFPRIIERQYGIAFRPDFYDMMQACADIYRSMSCASITELMRSRFIREDLPGLRTVQWLAKTAGVRLPVTERFASDVTRTAVELGAAAGDVNGYEPQLTAIPATVPHIKALLTDPHHANLAEAAKR
ncbi:NAD/NADP octopine/nopaline dehydrogenase family protein [Actinoplanes subglobosus]|uniref:NAD/NADP octopine/nopaline dehydrogenase family protein n=1 Tax=Actinoplanes subglobosus TaxID=1547892 RepID=A0ABV8JBP0_9ACTN